MLLPSLLLPVLSCSPAVCPRVITARIAAMSTRQNAGAAAIAKSPSTFQSWGWRGLRSHHVLSCMPSLRAHDVPPICGSFNRDGDDGENARPRTHAARAAAGFRRIHPGPSAAESMTPVMDIPRTHTWCDGILVESNFLRNACSCCGEAGPEGSPGLPLKCGVVRRCRLHDFQGCCRCCQALCFEDKNVECRRHGDPPPNPPRSPLCKAQENRRC